MELTNELTIPVPIERAWAVLTDLERIAPCLPGAELQEVDGDEHRGIVKVKVGPITAEYRGTATFVERDEAAGRAVLRAEGRDSRGQGTASATITAQLVASGGVTTVNLVTDLRLTGKVAQFGRGVLADVSAKLLDQFADRLRADVLRDDDAAVMPAAPLTAPAPAAATDQPRPHPGGTPPVDLLQTAGSPVARRVAPLLVVLALVTLAALWHRRRRR